MLESADEADAIAILNDFLSRYSVTPLWYRAALRGCLCTDCHSMFCIGTLLEYLEAVKLRLKNDPVCCSYYLLYLLTCMLTQHWQEAISGGQGLGR